MPKDYRRGPRDKRGRGVQSKVNKVMEEFRNGTLKSSNGEKVTKHDQAIAIALNEARETGEPVKEKVNG